MPVPKRNPRKEPMADFKEAAASFCANAISPMNAPPQAPIMIPHGCGKKMPIMRPIVQPIAPQRLPPVHLVNMPGTT